MHSLTSAKIQTFLERCKSGGAREGYGRGMGLTDFFLTNGVKEGQVMLMKFRVN